MKIFKEHDGTLQLQLNRKELAWLKQALNECCYGFGVDDAKATLGADVEVLQGMMDQITSSYSPLGQED